MSPANQLSEVPAELKALPNWVSWKLVERDGLVTKPPFIAGTNHYASSTNPETWTTFEAAFKTSTLSSTGGIGFVLNGAALEKKLMGFDLDGCRNPETGEIAPWAEQFIEAVDSYTEYTPSGYGIRVWAKGDLAGSEHVFELDQSAGFGDKVKIEAYDRDRYYTISGDPYFAESVNIETRDLAPIYALIREIQKKYPAASKAKSAEGDSTVASSSLQIKNDNGPVSTNKYVLLTHGIISGDKPCRIQDDHGNYMDYADRSAADMGLCNACAMKHGNNPDAIWEDYKASSLYREKEWGKREKYFREVTIARAIVSAGKIKAEAAAKTNAVGSPGDLLQWVEPHPFEPLLSPVPPFKIEYLPAAFRPWALDVAERMSVPLDYVGISMLCVFSSVLGRRAFVQPLEHDTSWKEAINLAGAVVAPSGGMKTPTWKTFVNEVIAIEVEWRKQHEQQMDRHKQEMAKYLEKNRGKKRDAREGVEPEAPEPRRRLVINDATPESALVLMEKFPEGLLLYRDEIGGWLAELDKPGRESQREMFLQAINGNDHRTEDRIGRGSISAMMCMAFFGGIQPRLAVDFVNDERNAADGTIARIGLLSWPDKHIFTRSVDRAVNETARSQFRRALRVMALLHEREVHLKHAPSAQPMFNDWLDAHRKKEDTLNGPVASHFSKYKGLLPRLAALYHLADAASATGARELAAEGEEVSISSELSVAGFHLIGREHLERAIAFLSEYLEPHMRRLYGCVKSPIQRAEASLAEHIHAGDLEDGFTVRDVTRKGWLLLTETENVRYTLETFCEMSWLRPMPRPAGQAGQPTIKYQINPACRR